jgi:hypothetical protein
MERMFNKHLSIVEERISHWYSPANLHHMFGAENSVRCINIAIFGGGHSGHTFHGGRHDGEGPHECGFILHGCLDEKIFQKDIECRKEDWYANLENERANIMAQQVSRYEITRGIFIMKEKLMSQGTPGGGGESVARYFR